jgi:hypothetical protein
MWIPLSIGLYALFRPAIATAVTLLGALLFLPERIGFDFPAFPPLDKVLIGNLSALLGTVLFARHRLRGQRIGRGIDALIFFLMAGAVLTAFTNTDSLSYGPAHLPALRVWDAISEPIQDFMNIGIPFLLGRVLFRSSRDLRFLFFLLVAAGLIYSLPILFEIRMSPQLHRVFYGFDQHRFSQTIRLGGYRPMVFMAHGLALSAFVLVTAMCAAALGRVRLRTGSLPAVASALYLSGLLVLCRSLGSMLYGIGVLPVVALASPRLQLWLASLLAALVLAYPLTRSLDLFPTESIVSFGGMVDEKRAESLQFRFDNEDQLLEKAYQRIWLGWGSYNRNRVFDTYTGEIVTITDGFWIIQFGKRGIVGFVTVFGLLLTPIWRAARHLSRIRSRDDRILIASLSLVVAVYCVDLLPNGFLSSFTILLAGALAGLIPGLQAEQRARRARAARRAAESADHG